LFASKVAAKAAPTKNLVQGIGESSNMQAWLLPYAPTVLAMGVNAALFLVQILVVDFAGIKARHVPGTPVPADHGSFLFRAVRAHANTNESLAGFVLLALFGMLSGAPALAFNLVAWTYVLGRAGHMACYYADLRTARSMFFGVGLAALLVMLALGLLPWLG
jgi:uncharacterized MAPEG superfamily protein